MGAHVFRITSDLLGIFGFLSLGASIYFVSGIPTALPWHDDLYQSAAWGRIFAGAVYAGLSAFFFWMLFLQR